MAKRPNNTFVGNTKNGFLARMMHFSPPTIVVWLALANRADKSLMANPSLTTIQQDTGLARPTVVKALAELKLAHEIEVTQGKGVGSKYVLTSSPPEPVQTVNQLSGFTGPVQTVNRTGSNGELTHNISKPDTRTRHKNQTKARGGAAAVVIPSELAGDDFREAWECWLSYRRNRKLTCTPATLHRQLRDLAVLGPTGAAAEIDNSITHGWNSVCYPKNGKAGNGRSYVGRGQIHDPTAPPLPVEGSF